MGFSYNVNVLNQKGSPAIYTDTFANRPSPGYAGRLFVSSDTSAIYEDTGTAWTLIANVSSGAGTLQQVTTNGNTSNVGIVISAGGLSTNSLTDTALTLGSVAFAGTGGLISQDNANLFWDDTNNRLGINTNTPGNSLDVHTGGTTPILALNNTAGSQSAISFLNTSTAKWRIGNTATNTFDIYNFSLSTNAISIDNAINTVKFDQYLLIRQGFLSNFISGYNSIGGNSNGFYLQLGTSTNTAYLDMSSLSAARSFTFPNASGTLALTSNLSSYLPLTGGTLTGALTVNVGGGLPALNIGNSSLSAKTWTLIPTTNGVDSDLAFYYTGTSSGTKVTFANTGAATFTATGGSFNIDVNGQIISKQNLDVATAGGRFTGQSARGTMGLIQIDQVTTGADGGQIKFSTCPSGSTTPAIAMTITSSKDVILNYGNSLAFNSITNQYISADATNLYLGTANSARLIINTSGNATFTGQVNVATNTIINYSAAVCQFYGNGSTNTFGLGANNTIYYQGDVSQFYPTADNTRNLGAAAYRYTTVYATTALINTSDINEKEQIEELSQLEKNVAIKLKGLIKKFKFKDAVNLKGDKARIHIGVIAQEVKQAFDEEGLNADEYGMFCSDTWYELEGKTVDKDTEGAIEKTRLGIRYEELITFIISQI